MLSKYVLMPISLIGLENDFLFAHSKNLELHRNIHVCMYMHFKVNKIVKNTYVCMHVYTYVHTCVTLWTEELQNT